MPEQTPRVGLLRRYLLPQRGRVAVMSVLLLASIGLALAEPTIVSHFIVSVQRGATEAALVAIAVVFLGVAIAQQCMRALATYSSQSVGWTATNQLRGDLMAHVLRLDPDFHESRSPGELIERIDGDVNEINDFFSSFVVLLIGNALLLIGILVALAFVDVRISLAFAALIAVVMFGLHRIQRFGTPQWEADRQHSALFYGYAGEVLTATEDVRSSGAESYALAGFLRRLRSWLPVNLRATAWSSSVWMGTIALFTGLTLLGYGFGGWLYGRGELALGGVYLVAAYALMLLAPVEAIRNQLQYLQQAAAAVIRVRELLAVRPRLVDGTADMPDGPLSVELDAVRFAYRRDGGDHGPAVLSDLELTVPAGRMLGLVGRTGAGKSTIAHLLFRMYDPVAGEVRLGGYDLCKVRLESLRSRVGLVTQDVHIFQASLRDNLTFFDPDVPDARLRDVLRLLGLGDWYDRLPDGLDSTISAGALSGGEAQLVAFARVFLKDPGLVILDEPSSRLDPATEHLLERALDRLLAGRTAVVIAHRLRTIRRADDVLVLGDGRVLEHGPAAALLADPDSQLSSLHRTGEVLV